MGKNVKNTTPGCTYLWGAHEDEPVRGLKANPLQRAVVGGRPSSDAQANQFLTLGQHARPLAEHFLNESEWEQTGNTIV